MTRSISGIALLLFLGGCSAQATHAQASEQQAAAINVASALASTRPIAQTLKLTGSLTANRESDVAADVAGRIAAVGIERGSEVRAGDVLARIDRRQAELQLDEARTQVASARARSSLAQIECDRARKLLERGAINQAEYDAQKTQCDDASLGVDAAVLKQQLASKGLVDLAVRAPFDGVVAERLVDPGEYVTRDTRVARIVQLDVLRLELSVPESALASFGHGAEVRFRVAAFPKETFVGRVRYVGAAVRRATRDLLVEAVVANEGRRLLPGMFATAEVVLGEVALPAVPAEAVRTEERAGTDRVFVIREGVIEERLVHKGPSSDGLIAIRSGVGAGERVVLSPSADIYDGARVQ